MLGQVQATGSAGVQSSGSGRMAQALQAGITAFGAGAVANPATLPFGLGMMMFNPALYGATTANGKGSETSSFGNLFGSSKDKSDRSAAAGEADNSSSAAENTWCENCENCSRCGSGCSDGSCSGSREIIVQSDSNVGEQDDSV